ncbi:hypothetical protein D3C76_1434840 [compost metagenome]
MGKVGELGVVAKQHHAPQGIAKLPYHRQQGLDVAGIEPLIDEDALGPEIERLGDDVRRRQGPAGGARQYGVGLDPGLCQPLAHQGGVTLTALSQRPRPVRQGNLLPARLGMAHQQQRSLHCPSPDGFRIAILC